MMRVDLKDGEWVELRSVDTIRAKDRKRILLVLDEVTGVMAQQFETTEMIVALAVERWSFNMPIPAEDVGSLDELSIPDYDAIVAACADYKDALFPDFGLKMEDGRLAEGPT